MRLKMRELHQLPSTKIVKSGTIRLTGHLCHLPAGALRVKDIHATTIKKTGSSLTAFSKLASNN